jgi:hypothetical protein
MDLVISGARVVYCSPVPFEHQSVARQELRHTETTDLKIKIYRCHSNLGDSDTYIVLLKGDHAPAEVNRWRIHGTRR